VIVAHALGGVKDLPVPGELFLYGGAAVLGLSFIALGALWHEGRLEEAAEGRPLPAWAQRILLAPALRIVLGALGTFVYVVVVIAAFAGVNAIDQNLAPTVVWVLFWLGLVWVTIFFGNVWAVISPFRAVADAVAWLTRSLRWEPFVYPERLGCWPAAVLLFAFTAMELVYPRPAEPRSLAGAIVIYSTFTWCGMLLFGRRAWLENGEAFNVYFGLFGRIAPSAVREEAGRREVIVRPPLAGLATFRARPGSLAFVAVMLGSVGFDSITRTSACRTSRPRTWRRSRRARSCNWCSSRASFSSSPVPSWPRCGSRASATSSSPARTRHSRRTSSAASFRSRSCIRSRTTSRSS
jgi:hypothetical protein